MAIRAAAAAPRGLRRLFSTIPTSMSTLFPPPANGGVSALEQAEPNTNLFVSGLSKRTTTERLQEAFSEFGKVVQARVVTDRVSGFSKGFGFVRYATLEDATKGIEGMHGKSMLDLDHHLHNLTICLLHTVDSDNSIFGTCIFLAVFKVDNKFYSQEYGRLCCESLVLWWELRWN
ncbi:Glycine-rich RNA-binding protein [Quillaja saponaria]|uniref:Glycine-rich RNA-binding protein n=1 Tax=Quillaja saponaria TaxID=32244 RepID=A0AAD7QHQ5_QUISA|nr:Glycine-rich RNA-binding protein [Quillaja saponaria]